MEYLVLPFLSSKVILELFTLIGCMNNLTFGNERFGYYETVAGGAGAGPLWEGRSGIHTHMTNTRITDPEVLEKYYPVILEGNAHIRSEILRYNTFATVLSQLCLSSF